jgi:hypothetical protein
MFQTHFALTNTMQRYECNNQSGLRLIPLGLYQYKTKILLHF